MVAIQLLCATMAQATEFEISGITYTITDAAAKTVGVTYYDDSQEISGNVVIPSSISYNGVIYNITSISDGAFSGCNGITSIEIPNSVTKIGTDAFYRCGGLKSVTIDCKNVGSWFSDSSIKEFIIGNNVTTIEKGAFYSCNSLTSVTIGNRVRIIGKTAFRDCRSLTSITIPKNVTIIENYAFYNTGLTEIYSMSSSPATIDLGTFNYFSATLYVPIGAKAAYQAADYWKEFSNIVEMDFTGIDDIEAEDSFQGIKDAYYELNGRIAVSPTKGIYIRNGKKIVVE